MVKGEPCYSERGIFLRTGLPGGVNNYVIFPQNLFKCKKENFIYRSRSLWLEAHSFPKYLANNSF
jgi:hypothetical protein